MRKKSTAKKTVKRKPMTFDPVKLSKKMIDRSEAVQDVLATEPGWGNIAEAYAEAARAGMPMTRVARQYDVMQDAGLAEPIFSAGRLIEYNMGITHALYRKMPRIEALPAYLPADARKGVPVEAETRDGTLAARRYLHGHLLGYVRRMLARLHANGQDVRGEAEVLCAEIRGLVDEILEQKGE